jgi:ATP/maltotriose-dependent transcriptional regulator MalT
VGDPDGLRRAEAAGAVVVGDRVRFAHPLVAGAVEGVDPERRRALHGRIAAEMTDPVARASHLGLAAVPPDPTVAAELEDAAQLAAARGAPLTAARLLERALALLPAALATRRAAAAVTAARLHYTGGDERQGRVILQRIRDELPAGPGRVEVLMGLAELEDQPVEEALALARQALDEAGDDPGLRARVLIGKAEYQGIGLEFEAGAASAREAARLAAGTGDRPLEADALSHAANLVAPLGGEDPAPLLERAAGLAEQESGFDPWWRPRFSLERWRVYTDDLDAAARALERRRAVAAARGDDHERHAACLHLAELECRRGRLDAARGYAGEGLDLTEQLGADLSRASLVYARALVAAHAGVRAEAEALAGEGIEICRRIGFRWMELQLRHVLGLPPLADGDHAAAAALLVPLMADLEAHGLWDPGMIPAHPDAIEAAIGTGLLVEAGAWLATYEEVGRRLDRPRALACGARCRGLLHAAHGDLPAALAALERALAEHERLPVPLERARTLLVLGTIQRRLKQRAAARASLEEAASAFDAIGAEAWASRARAELARIGGRAPGGDGLTATEARVARLVAAGRSNREVAAELFVSVRAVEANLSRVYTKLGVRGRTELAGRLARGGEGR